MTYVTTFDVMLNGVTLFYMKTNLKSPVRCLSRRFPLDFAEINYPELALGQAVTDVPLMSSSDIPKY
jgi:hypothetical protein